mgnify:CR=1 FL=1
MPDISPPPIVLCVWEDAKALDDATWVENKDHTYKPHLFQQVGFLLSATDDGVILTHAWHPEMVAGRDQIPRAMVRSITPLEPAKPTRKRK